MNKYETYKKMCEFLNEIDTLYDKYVKEVEEEYKKLVYEEEDLDAVEEKSDKIWNAFDAWEKLKDQMNEMCFEIIESKE